VPGLYLDPGKYRTRLTEETEEQYVRVLREHGVGVVLLAGFMRVIHERFLRAFPDTILNVHPSLLPAFPGLRGPKQAIEYGAMVAGCTIHIVNEMVDGGPVLAQEAIPVLPGDDAKSLTQRIQAVEHRLYPETVRRFLTTAYRLDGRRVIWEGA
jgi:phosphoribosylglycinamide formyltransferase-1